ncbi:MAG: transposase [Deltaproteobacteria bacterium]|nr:transposase [Deltaproteobacteria bacterium]
MKALQAVGYALTSDESRNELARLISSDHPLVLLEAAVSWNELLETLKPIYLNANDLSSFPPRLMLGLHYLRRLYGLNDQQLVDRWEHDPYWQYFCGSKYFEKKLALKPEDIKNWRQLARTRLSDFDDVIS